MIILVPPVLYETGPGFCTFDVNVEAPDPKFHDHDVGVFVEMSVNVTAWLKHAVVVVDAIFATGGNAHGKFNAKFHEPFTLA